MVAAVVFQPLPAGIGCWLEGAALAPGSTLIIITTHCNSHVNHSGAEGRGAAGWGDGPGGVGGYVLNTSSRP